MAATPRVYLAACRQRAAPRAGFLPISPRPITIAELRRLFLAGLDSVGLAPEPEGKLLRIIDAARARRGAERVR
jgi:hypothetical protein